MFFVSQVVAGSVSNIDHLWIASALLGLAHGSVFSLFPTVCLEWFGMRKCRPTTPFFSKIEREFYLGSALL